MSLLGPVADIDEYHGGIPNRSAKHLPAANLLNK